VITSCTSWEQFLVYVSPAVAALLSAIALWVASRAHSTSKDVRQTLEATTQLVAAALPSPPVTVVQAAPPDQPKP
jgi:NO-binding membrane sensor protein with MHYT domain